MGWACKACSYFHHAPAPRCVMCNELRISRQEMADFATKGVTPSEPSSCKQPNRGVKNLTQSSMIITSTKSNITKKPLNNPYAQTKPSRTATSTALTKTTGTDNSKGQSNSKESWPQPGSALARAESGSSCADASGVRGRSNNSNNDNTAAKPSRKRPLTEALNGRPPPPIRPEGKPPVTLVYSPGPVPIDPATASEWVYPSAEDYPKRQYQLDISSSAIFHNTLVSLPTGLGKTLIAAVVLYNYYRWFPSGKVLFLAPTLPLVNQQVQACYRIMGIPPGDTAVMTGKLSPARRAEIWRTKRVFFCTPQTVERDLEAGTCPAEGVVCVVLDEAHKATGDYAYCRVVQYLESNKAKFRILGLSATPGTNIKAIQAVVDTLRINKIEARLESDPEVIKHTHTKQTEIVIVSQGQICVAIEKTLNELIAPYLDRLKQSGVLSSRFSNSNIAPFTLLQAQKDYEQRPGADRGGAMSQLIPARALVQLRTDLQKHGIGTARIKLSRLRTTPQRGAMASFVKSNEFDRLWKAVDAACNPSESTQANLEDQVRHNPKLGKLKEILVEHFERARATQKSSRAIVFSQLRDSVSEIVQVLNQGRPLIRPRHFVGQGSGSKGDGASGALKGMKQAEQHEAIGEFRNDVYNVLVCTCIGEEGLDIGEVDLIVNFDVLRSPIRSIQRTGRTGRKRDGRVVSLVGEGAEQRTMQASKQAERNLAHALKSHRTFKVTPTIPMLPEKPKLVERNMCIASQFQVSQVEGHDGAKKAHSASGQTKKIGWRLTSVQEHRRSSELGLVKCAQGRSCVLEGALRRRLLLARDMSASAHRKTTGSGCVVKILGELNNSHPRLKLMGVGTRRDRDSVAIRKLFPLHHEGAPRRTDYIVNTTSRHVEPKHCRQVSTNPDTCQRGQPMAPLVVNCQSEPPKRVDDQCRQNTHPTDTKRKIVKINPYGKTTKAPPSSRTVVSRAEKLPAVRNEESRGHDQVLLPNTKRNEQGLALSGPHLNLKTRVEAAKVKPPSPSSKSSHTDTCKDSAFYYDDDDASRGSSDRTSTLKTNVACDQRTQQTKPSSLYKKPDLQKTNKKEGFCLASTMKATSTTSVKTVNNPYEKRSDGPPSIHATNKESNCERDSDAQSSIPWLGSDHTQFSPKDTARKHDDTDEDVFVLPDDDDDSSVSTEESRCGSDVPNRPLLPSKPLVKNVLAEEPSDIFVLSTQDSSSEDESQNEKPAPRDSYRNDRVSTGVRFEEAIDSRRLPSSASVQAPTRNASEQGAIDTTDTFCLQSQDSSSSDDDSDNDAKAPGIYEEAGSGVRGGNSRSVDETQNSSEKSQHLVFHGRPQKRRAILDTQDSEGASMRFVSRATNQCSGQKEVSFSCQLVDTPSKEGVSNDASEIVCAVCNSGESEAENPIVLCDGSVDGSTCNLAVHSSCYSIPITVVDQDGDWFCDLCRYRQQGLFSGFTCRFCEKTGGALKRSQANYWFHVRCEDKGKHKTIEKGSPRTNDAHARRKRRREHFSRFIADEADIASDEDPDGDQIEEQKVAEIEEQEDLESSFINDSSQLGFTQDELGRVDPDADNDNAHRELDATRQRAEAFATPTLNRRMKSRLSSATADTPDSSSGLGNMHFIRSVIEHHRQGGDADMIEEYYNEI